MYDVKNSYDSFEICSNSFAFVVDRKILNSTALNCLQFTCTGRKDQNRFIKRRKVT